MADHSGLVRDLRVALVAAARPEDVAPMAAYLKNQFEFVGVKAPQRRVAEKPLLATVPVDRAEALDIADALWAEPEREFHYAAADYLRRRLVRAPGDPTSTLRRLRRLIEAKSWWDTVDALSPTLGALLETHPDELGDHMDDWIRDDNIWIIRSALLYQLTYKERTDADRLFRYCAAQAGHDDFFVRKAIGWALRHYARTEPDRVRDFVDRHRDELSALSIREATKHL